MGFLGWSIVILYCVLMIAISLYLKRRASRNIESYFIGGRKLPWWLIGLSSVAHYGAAPINFVWWFFIGGYMEIWLVAWVSWSVWMPLVTVIWAKLWRRLGVVTTAEFIEVRYGGTFAGVYRSLYGTYAFFVWAVASMAYGGAIFIQVARPILGWRPIEILLIFGGIIVLYTSLSGLEGVAYSVLPQLFLIFAGAFILMFILVSKVGGFAELYRLLSQTRGSGFFKPFPPGNKLDVITLIVLMVQGFFFAGNPFAGEGATAQRFMAAKDERNAVLGQMFNLVLSLAIRLIPALFIAMAIIVLYPAKTVTFAPALWARAVKDYCSPGVLGFLFAAAVASYMATTAATLNWGIAYFINDVYKRRLRPRRKNREYILMSRLVTVGALALAYSISLSIDAAHMEPWALFINSVVGIFSLPLAWLKWFWWRMNAVGDAVGILAGVPAGALIWFGSDAVIPAGIRKWIHHVTGLNINGIVPRFGDLSRYPFWIGFLLIFVIGWVVTLTATLLTKPETEQVLMNFYEKARPLGLWGPIAKKFPEPFRRGISNETKLDLLACGAGVIFSFSLMISFFSFYARWYKTALYTAPVFFVMGYCFYKLTMISHRQSATG